MAAGGAGAAHGAAPQGDVVTLTPTASASGRDADIDVAQTCAMEDVAPSSLDGQQLPLQQTAAAEADDMPTSVGLCAPQRCSTPGGPAVNAPQGVTAVGEDQGDPLKRELPVDQGKAAGRVPLDAGVTQFEDAPLTFAQDEDLLSTCGTSSAVFAGAVGAVMGSGSAGDSPRALSASFGHTAEGTGRTHTACMQSTDGLEEGVQKGPLQQAAEDTAPEDVLERPKGPLGSAEGMARAVPNLGRSATADLTESMVFATAPPPASSADEPRHAADGSVDDGAAAAGGADEFAVHACEAGVVPRQRSAWRNSAGAAGGVGECAASADAGDSLDMLATPLTSLAARATALEAGGAAPCGGVPDVHSPRFVRAATPDIGHAGHARTAVPARPDTAPAAPRFFGSPATPAAAAARALAAAQRYQRSPSPPDDSVRCASGGSTPAATARAARPRSAGCSGHVARGEHSPARDSPSSGHPLWASPGAAGGARCGGPRDHACGPHEGPSAPLCGSPVSFAPPPIQLYSGAELCGERSRGTSPQAAGPGASSLAMETLCDVAAGESRFTPVRGALRHLHTDAGVPVSKAQDLDSLSFGRGYHSRML